MNERASSPPRTARIAASAARRRATLPVSCSVTWPMLSPMPNATRPAAKRNTNVWIAKTLPRNEIGVPLGLGEGLSVVLPRGELTAGLGVARLPAAGDGLGVGFLLLFWNANAAIPIKL